MKPSSSNPRDYLPPASKPLVLVLSGPSGAGKDAVLNCMKSRHLPLAFIVTSTTRPQRSGEVDNVHYHFVSRQDFRCLLERHELLEHAAVYGHFYGVPRQPVREALAQGKDVIIKVDVQGAMTIKKKLPQAVLVFLMPPSIDELAQRLKQRNTESAGDLELRLNIARAELKKLGLFDYLVTSYEDQVERAANDIEAIITAEKRRIKPREYRL